ncbi:MAG: hypothetical protein AB9873_01525 [Syntrophobacteraceae bacterium]
MIRLLIYGFVAYFAYQLFKLLARKLFPSNFSDDDGQKVQRGDQNTELIQDPQCGTYFLKQHGVIATIQGRRLHFCSEKCRDSYLARHQDA